MQDIVKWKGRQGTRQGKRESRTQGKANQKGKRQGNVKVKENIWT
jgi:hypothetical protein